MSRVGLAWRILTSGKFAQQVKTALAAVGSQNLPETNAIPHKTSPQPPFSGNRVSAGRSDAVTLLATLQREARLVDFLKESLDGYTDAQVGAAVRDIHRECASVLERQFAVRPLLQQPEGSSVDVGTAPDPGRYKLSGPMSSSAAPVGRLLHHGWEISHCELPQWSGSADMASIIAPAEIEVGNR